MSTQSESSQPNGGAASVEHQRIQTRKSLESEIELSLESEHNFYTGFTENISSGGLFIATRDLQPIGTVMEISFTIPGYEQKIATRAEVRWLRLEQLGQHDMMPGVGVRFLDLHPNAAAAINAFIGERDSLFYDDD